MAGIRRKLFSLNGRPPESVIVVTGYFYDRIDNFSFIWVAEWRLTMTRQILKFTEKKEVINIYVDKFFFHMKNGNNNLAEKNISRKMAFWLISQVWHFNFSSD